MRTTPRPRRYVSPATLAVLGPLFVHDPARQAYRLRAVGGRVGPVLRVDRRSRRTRVAFDGPERRAA